MTMLPTSAKDYIANQLSPAPDLYGPFWTLTTVIFSLFVFSGLSSSIASYLGGQPIDYDFKLLSIAVSLVYSYGLGVPILLWLALRYLGVTEWSVVEARHACLPARVSRRLTRSTGRSHFRIWTVRLDPRVGEPEAHSARKARTHAGVQLICVAPFRIVRYVFVGLAFGLSGFFLVANVYPILATVRLASLPRRRSDVAVQAEAKSTRLLVIIIAVLHAALAISFQFLFFSYYPLEATGGEQPVQSGEPPATGGAAGNSTRLLL